MKFFGLKALAAILLTLPGTACSVTGVSDEVFLADRVPAKVLAPEAFFGKAEAEIPHFIHGEYNGEEWTAEGVLKLTHDELVLVASAPVGRLFTLKWNSAGVAELKKGALSLGVPVNPYYLLMDLTLIYGDLAALQQHFSAPWKIAENARERVLFLGEKPAVKIVYSEASPFSGIVILENLSRGYRYTIVAQP